VSLRYGTFGGDFDELARLVATEWAAHYQGEPHFGYSAEWLAGFLGGAGDVGSDPELLVECRDDAGALAGFVAAVPRRGKLGDRSVKLAVCTLLTSTRANAKAVPGFGLLRELFRRCPVRGIDATYHFCVSTQRTHEILIRSAMIEKRAAIALAPVGSTMALARASSDATPNVRELGSGGSGGGTDAALVAGVIELIGAAGRAIGGDKLARVESASSLLAGKRGFAVLREGVPIAACTFAHRRMVGKVPTEIANVDLLVGPDATEAESIELGRAVSAAAAASGAQVCVAPGRPLEIFPHAKRAGFRTGARTLRAYAVQYTALGLTAGATHLLEVE
jgi:hypothetical protein